MSTSPSAGTSPSPRRGWVDVHTHIVPPLPELPGPDWPLFSLDEDVGRLSVAGRVVRTVPPEAWSPDQRIAEMDRRGVAHHIVSPLPPLVPQGGVEAEAAEWALKVNDSLASLVAPYRDRLTGFGVVAQAHPHLLSAQVVRAHDQALRGVLVGTDFGGRELSSPELDDFYAALSDRGMVLFVHPIATTLDSQLGDRIPTPPWQFGLGMTTDTAIAAGHLVFGGVLDRHPELRVCLAHGGGTFFWALGRARRLMSQAQLDALAVRLRHVFVDSVVYDAASLSYLLQTAGAAKIAFGTDYPLPAEDATTVNALQALGTEQQAALRYATASTMLAWH